MNILLIISDSLRADYCGCYGNSWVQTPNINAMASESVKFTQFFAASFPTRPMRKDVHSGRFTFTYTGWGGDWARGEVTIAEVLKQQGYTTALIADTPANVGFERGFDHFEIFTGQGGGGVALDEGEEFKLPADPRKLRIPLARLYRLLKTESLWKSEEDRFVAQTMRAATRWLESQYRASQPFFLLVDTFDPHEPWNPPRYYIDMYDADYDGDELFEPAYEPADYATEREIKHMRCMYAGEVSLVDRWIGYLLEAIRRLGMEDDTAIILTSDHGFYHGEHNFIGKVQLDRENRICLRWPLYRTIAQAPLLIKIPQVTSQTTFGTFCQPPDLMPTILDLVDAPIPSTVQGQSLLPLIHGKEDNIRDVAITSCNYIQDNDVRCPTSYRTADYIYIYGGDEWQSELYDLQTDPNEERNILNEHPQTAQQLHQQYLDFLRDIKCPPERIEGRKVFNPTPREDVPYTRML